MATSEITVVSDQKKRALEALERRFAVAKAEILQHQQMKKQRVLKEEIEEEGESKYSSSFPSPACKPKASAISSPLSSSKKDVEAYGPAYLELSQPVHENLLRTSIDFSSGRGSTVDKIVHELLQKGDSAQKYMHGLKSMKIDNWLLLDSFVRGRSASMIARGRAIQSHSKRSKRHMSMQQHRKCGSFDLPQEFHNYNLFKPMHEMWKGYISQLLKNIGKNQLPQALLAADLHGAILLVVECKITAFTGVSGIMIRETGETFGMMTQGNKFQVVPKKGSVLIFRAECWKITLHGDKLSSRNIG